MLRHPAVGSLHPPPPVTSLAWDPVQLRACRDLVIAISCWAVLVLSSVVAGVWGCCLASKLPARSSAAQQFHFKAPLEQVERAYHTPCSLLLIANGGLGLAWVSLITVARFR
jgi:hypothetical protein